MTASVSTTQAIPNAARFSAGVNGFATAIAISILLTSSFDVFLVLEAGGNYRFCQLMTVLLIGLAIIKAARGGRIPVLSAVPLTIWCMFQFLFIPATEFWPKSLAYCLWLVLDIGLIFSFVQLFSDDICLLVRLLRWYVYSFAFVATFGISQFLLPVLGFGGPLVQQWLVPRALARVNGFSYEPSYFATYLLIGFVFIGSLRRSRFPLLSGRTLLTIYTLVALAVVLSCSRMGICFLFLDLLLSQLRPWLSFLNDILRFRIALFKVRSLIPSLLLILLVGGIGTVTSIAVERNPELTLALLNGTGIADTPAHSVVQRQNRVEDTLAAFFQHPLIGRSLGGVSVAIAGFHGAKIHSFEASKEFEGMSVFAEALAASGIIGIIPFAWFLVATILKPWRLGRVTGPFYSEILRALLRSLVFGWAILQLNQNILRPYLWTHLAILATVYAAARQSVARAPAVRNSSYDA